MHCYTWGQCGSRQRVKENEGCRGYLMKEHEPTPTTAISSIQFKCFIFYIAFPFRIPKQNFVRCYPVVLAMLWGIEGGGLMGGWMRATEVGKAG